MARAVQHFYTKTVKGKKISVACTNWYVKWYDAAERRTRKSPTEFSDKKLAERYGRQLENESEMRAAGITTPVKIDPSASVDAAITEFEQHLADKEVTRRQIQQVVANIRKYTSGRGIYLTSDITEASVVAHLAASRRAGLGAQTRNHILRNVKQFTRWMVRRKYLLSDPLLDMKPVNVASDRRYVRRAMDPQEFARLFNATWKSKVERKGLNGKTRAMLYLIAICTGLRRKELASLTVGSVSLKPVPTITVEAGESKRRKRDVLPCDSVKHLAEFVKGRAATDRLFETTYRPKEGVKMVAWARRSAAILAADLEAAGLSVRDGRGRVADLHSLRVSCITELIRQGVPLVTVQKYARHSTPVLTANIYTDTTSEDLAVAGKSLRFGKR
jgi:integrase/recombinase XerD